MKIFNYLLNYFRPSVFVDKIENINFQIFLNPNIKAIFCDLDNTLVPHFTKFPTKAAIKFCQDIKNIKKLFFIVSNNSRKRVKTFCDLLEPDDFIFKAKKPLAFKVKKILKKYNLLPSEVLFIGDQFVFDIFLANKLHAKSILVLPIISSTNSEKNRFLDWIERFIYKKLEHNNIIVTSKETFNDDEIL